MNDRWIKVNFVAVGNLLDGCGSSYGLVRCHRLAVYSYGCLRMTMRYSYDSKLLSPVHQVALIPTISNTVLTLTLNHNL